MQKQFLVTLDTAVTPAVVAVEITTPGPTVPVGSVFVAEYDEAKLALNAVEEEINGALLKVVRGLSL